MHDAHRTLIRLLRRAHAGELAAASAYAGHWRATRDPADRRRIADIEREEHHHRAVLAAHLAQLGARPSPWLEALRGGLGLVLRVLCAVTPELILATVAARLERRGVAEYENASRVAAALGMRGMATELRALGRVEGEHQAYFSALAIRLARAGRRQGKLSAIQSARPSGSAGGAGERDPLGQAAGRVRGRGR